MTNAEITALVGRLVELQLSTQEQLKQLGEHIDGFVETVNAHVTASNARMERMEANLDALIRAITAGRANGKKKH